MVSLKRFILLTALLLTFITFLTQSNIFGGSQIALAHDYSVMEGESCDSDHLYSGHAPPLAPGFAFCRHNNSTNNSPSIFNLIDDPLPEGKFTSLGQIVSMLLPFILTLGGMVTLLFLIWGGIRYMTAQGDPKQVGAARATIMSAIIGLIILISIFVILSLIADVFEVNILAGGVSSVHAISIGDNFLFGGAPITDVFKNLGELVTSVVNFALAAAGLVFFFMLILGSMRYMLSRGDDKLITEARQTLTNAVVGLLIIIASFAIIKLLEVATGANLSIF